MKASNKKSDHKWQKESKSAIKEYDEEKKKCKKKNRKKCSGKKGGIKVTKNQAEKMPREEEQSKNIL